LRIQAALIAVQWSRAERHSVKLNSIREQSMMNKLLALDTFESGTVMHASGLSYVLMFLERSKRAMSSTPYGVKAFRDAVKVINVAMRQAATDYVARR
jgi:hypothetical protein